MITVQQTIDILKQNQPGKKITDVELMHSLDMVLAQEIIATTASPPYTNSAMDGFAVRWQDIQNKIKDNPLELFVAGESSAGSPFKKPVNKNQAIRISTGAIVPDDCDTIIPIEQCIDEQNKVKILEAGKKHQHIRFAGEEYKAGKKLLEPGIRIGSAQIALMASQGINRLKVYKKPEVIIMTTGSELVPFDSDVKADQLRDSNTPMLLAAVLEAGALVKKNVHVKDDPQVTLKTIEEALANTDIIISSGGVSMGKHDHVRDMALKAGFNELFWKVRQKPGKPMFLAKKEQTLLIALPGNPVSAYICFKHYVRPLLQSVQGKDFSWPFQKAVVTETIRNTLNRSQLMRVKLNKTQELATIEVLEKQGSHMSSTIAQADGYIILNEGASLVRGSETIVYLY